MSDSDGNGKKFDFAVQGASTTPYKNSISSSLRVLPLFWEVVLFSSTWKRPTFYTILVIPDEERYFFSLWIHSLLLSKTNISSIFCNCSCFGWCRIQSEREFGPDHSHHLSGTPLIKKPKANLDSKWSSINPLDTVYSTLRYLLSFLVIPSPEMSSRPILLVLPVTVSNLY